ncbi:MAG: branched-chain amino acid ABC transporter substrate-binding protein [Solirubrobacteraceae bacterium]
MRHPRTAATVVALALAVAGCGGSGTSNGGNSFGNALTIYTALPVDGPQGLLMQSIEDGEELAIKDAGVIVHGHLIILQPWTDSSESAGGWDTTDASNAAANATQSVDAVAYIGDFDSAATATSLPITNAADILQVSPASPYIGLTDPSVYDDKGEPGSYYPSGVQTFARLVPSDAREASATASFMQSLGVQSLYTLEDNDPGNTPFDSVVATMVGADAAHAGITLAGTAQTDTATDTTPVQYAPLVKAIAATHADAVFVGSAADPGAEALWQELYAKLPGVKLFAPSTLATGPFRESLGAAAGATYVTSPILPLDQYGPQAQGVLRRYRREFRGSVPTAWSLYGYEAMASVLAAIKKAGKHANDRRTVVSAYFHLGWRDSVIGRYRITSSGDTSQARFVGYRAAADGQLIEIRRHLGGA